VAAGQPSEKCFSKVAALTMNDFLHETNKNLQQNLAITSFPFAICFSK
jgi:hypothetical protein